MKCFAERIVVLHQLLLEGDLHVEQPLSKQGDA
jgi:hypothetical protein